MSFEGEGSANRRESTKRCPKCKKMGQVYYTGSNVLHGNPYTPAADTEVEHYYECRHCGYEFKEYA